MQYSLGKLPARKDPRTIKLSSILKTLPPPPDSFSVDTSLPPMLNQMFGNDRWGDCVIAARANQTMRFEAYEHGVVPSITTQQCLDEYWKEEGYVPSSCWLFKAFQGPPPDNGLVALDSLNSWRKEGWIMGTQPSDKIHAFASALSELEFKLGCQYLEGVQVGVALPKSAEDQFSRNMPWEVVPDDGGIVGGHMIYGKGYNPTGPIIVTWAKEVQCTWDWYSKYRDEAYVCVDNADSPDSPVDMAKLDAILQQITA